MSRALSIMRRPVIAATSAPHGEAEARLSKAPSID
jgi:hypothetical protein